jgi:superfamily II DNA or RNA helicase
VTATSPEAESLLAAGSQVVVRDAEWLITQVQPTPTDGLLVRCLGTSGLVRDTEATFFAALDHIEPLQPDDTVLINDDSPRFRTSRLYLESLIRKTPVPATEAGLAVATDQLLDPLDYQQRAVHKALSGLRPRLLIADAVGLGKTLEVGMILSELIRRGRGERVLVVTPQHILEQFQHELWTRFAIPLVRLDSEGIQRVRRQIPGNRNPFTHFKRAIISIDTLKNAGRYRHHLEGIRWDAVVIDECHNLVNRGTLNNQLARVLAPRTEALLLTSATPHNGDPDSFAELIRLLDPTAIADAKSIEADAIDHLYVRRHKHHDDVSAEVAANWAERAEPRPLLIPASDPENALLAEIADTWTHPRSGQAPTSGKGRTLFPWTLFKSALSSHHALAQTVARRRQTLAGATKDENGSIQPLTPAQQAEDDALARLEALVAVIGDAEASKLQALIDELRSIGVGPRSKTRVVVFSERIATLEWLAATVPTALGLKSDQVRVLHGGKADTEQMQVIEDFGLADHPVRLLLTGDMASEGVNLHRQCHHLIHFDLPWSLITIEQRNGRIDRYGQTNPPEIRALLLKPQRPDLDGDIRVLTKLLEREHQAHKAFGDSGSLLGLHNVEAEEEAVTRRLHDGAGASDPDGAIPATPKAGSFDLLALLTGGTGNDPIPTFPTPTLFDSDLDFVNEALADAFDDPDKTLDRRRDDSHPELVSIVPPPDLIRRLAVLPATYLDEQRIVDRFRLTADRAAAEARLERARNATDSSWPDIGHLSPLHPLMEWLAEKVLAGVGRNEAPIMVADVDGPVFCVQGLYANGRGQPQLVEWLAITPPTEPGAARIDDLFDVLAKAGVGASMSNPGRPIDPAPLQAHLSAVVEAARAELETRRAAHDAELDRLLEAPTARLAGWIRASQKMAFQLDERRRRDKESQIRDVRADTEKLIESSRVAGRPLVRVIAVLAPPPPTGPNGGTAR